MLDFYLTLLSNVIRYITLMNIRSMRKSRIAMILCSAAAVAGGAITYLSLNEQFDLIMPDGEEVDNAVLSQDNYSRLKQNVGIFTVYRPHLTMGNATSGYCRIAEFIHENEDGYNDTIVGNTTVYDATSPPQWCSPELSPLPVPEFSKSTDLSAASALAVAASLVIINGRRL